MFEKCLNKIIINNTTDHLLIILEKVQCQWSCNNIVIIVLHYYPIILSKALTMTKLRENDEIRRLVIVNKIKLKSK